MFQRDGVLGHSKSWFCFSDDFLFLVLLKGHFRDDCLLFRGFWKANFSNFQCTDGFCGLASRSKSGLESETNTCRHRRRVRVGIEKCSIVTGRHMENTFGETYVNMGNRINGKQVGVFLRKKWYLVLLNDCLVCAECVVGK